MTLKTHLEAYCNAFNARSLDGVLDQFTEHALFEMPLLGQRLFGRAEIAAGLRCIFAATETASLAFPEVVASDLVVIAEGQLRGKLHRDTTPFALPAAVVLEAKAGKIARLSTYLDARLHRLWSDGPIFAPAQAWA